MKSIFFILVICLFSSCSSSKKEDRTYKISRDPSWYPLYFFGQEASVLGFSDDLINTIAAEQGLKVTLTTSSWDNLNQGLKEGLYNAICTSMPKILANVKNYSFSDNYLDLGPILIVPINSSFTTLNSLEGYEVGVVSGSTIELQILEKFPLINIHTYLNEALLFEDILAGNIDGVMMPSLKGSLYVRDLYSDSLKIATKPMSDEGLKIATLYEENEEFLQKFNQGLKKLKEQGTLDQLMKKWQLR